MPTVAPALTIPSPISSHIHTLSSCCSLLYLLSYLLLCRRSPLRCYWPWGSWIQYRYLHFQPPPLCGLIILFCSCLCGFLLCTCTLLYPNLDPTGFLLSSSWKYIQPAAPHGLLLLPMDNWTPLTHKTTNLLLLLKLREAQPAINLWAKCLTSCNNYWPLPLPRYLEHCTSTRSEWRMGHRDKWSQGAHSRPSISNTQDIHHRNFHPYCTIISIARTSQCCC